MSQTMAPVLGEATIQELREAVRGAIFTPSDEGYEEACRVWNGAHDGRRPALVVRCTGAADVIARDRLRPQQRPDRSPCAAAGTASPGFSTCDGGIVIDLSPMSGVRVDPESRARDRRRRRRLGGRRPRDAGARPRDDRRPRLDHRRRRLHARRRHRLADAQARPRVRQPRRAPTSSPPTAGSCTRARPRTPTCSGACAAAAATSASSTQFELQLHPVGPMVYAGADLLPGRRRRRPPARVPRLVRRRPGRASRRSSTSRPRRRCR